jgi:hypothetical protein
MSGGWRDAFYRARLSVPKRKRVCHNFSPRAVKVLATRF